MKHRYVGFDEWMWLTALYDNVFSELFTFILLSPNQMWNEILVDSICYETDICVLINKCCDIQDCMMS